MVRILIADDHQLLIDGIITTLSDIEDFEIVAFANNGVEVLQVLKTVKADIVLMDINMPVMDGLVCTKNITAQYPATKVIVLTQYDEKRLVKRMVKNGACGYLLKDATKAELVFAIRNVFQGGTYFSQKLTLDNIDATSVKSIGENLFPKLTEREVQVLNYICMGNSSQEIGEILHISYYTVETHRANLMEKARAKNTADLVRWALENEFVKL